MTISPQEMRAVLEFSRRGMMIAPGAGYLSLADRAQLIGLWRGFWDPAAIELTLVVGPSFEFDLEVTEAIGIRLEFEP